MSLPISPEDLPLAVQHAFEARLLLEKLYRKDPTPELRTQLDLLDEVHKDNGAALMLIDEEFYENLIEWHGVEPDTSRWWGFREAQKGGV